MICYQCGAHRRDLVIDVDDLHSSQITKLTRGKKKKKKVKNAIDLSMRSTLMSDTDLRGNFPLILRKLRF